MPDLHELVIVGSGPAGLTAAVYAGRANLQPIVIEGIGAGGQLMLTTDVENYPGFPDGILGPELMMKFREQAERFGAEFVTADADRVELSEASPFGVWVGEREFRARSMIITTGASARMLGLAAEQRLLGPRRVSTCATCDGFFFREKPIAVVGGGDSAIEEAIFLTKFATKVTLVHRRDELRASKIMQDRALANPKIEFKWNSEVSDVVGDGSVDAIRLRDTVTGERVRARGARPVRRHRSRPEHRAVPWSARPRRERLHRDVAQLHAHLRRRRVRGGRRAGPRVPAGDHRRGLGVHGRDRSRAVVGRARARGSAVASAAAYDAGAH